MLDNNDNVSVKDENGSTVMHSAVIGDSKTVIIDLLLSKNADLYAQNTYGNTPLHDAAGAGQLHVSIFKYVMSKINNVNLKNKEGRTFLTEGKLFTSF